MVPEWEEIAATSMAVQNMYLPVQQIILAVTGVLPKLLII
jgi:hypothetical protein